MMIACMLFTAAAYTFTACNSTEEPVKAQPDGQTAPMTRAATIENFARHLIVDANDVNILNAGEYYLSNGEPFFTHVVILASNICGDRNGVVYLENDANTAAILENPDKYIKPLQAKGIKILLGYQGGHTGAGVANLKEQQAESLCDKIVAAGESTGADGFFINDEWADYGISQFWPLPNQTSYSNVLIKLRNKSGKIITVLDWGYTTSLSPTAAECIDLLQYAGKNSYSSSSFLPTSRFLPYTIDLATSQSVSIVKVYTVKAKNTDSGGIGLWNLPMEPTRLATLNAAAQAFGLTCTHTGTTHPKDYGN